ncbi:MAG: hypothetical protein H7X97_08570 [Opitutaceae bacterium]|nr:hypothetical protein [Verrucomicrobiales bacterium]
MLLLLIGLGGFGAIKILRGSASPSASLSPPPDAGVVAGIERQSGPWGELEIQDIQIDPPDEYAARLYVPTNHGVWFFGAGYDGPKVLSLFASADLTRSQRSELVDPAHWKSTAQGIFITPQPRTVFSLSSPARSRIYRALAEFPENFFQSSPFMFSKARADDWFFHSGLAAETVALVSSLLYPHGSMLCFSDVGILTHIGSDAEKTRLIMALSRTPTVLVNLRIPPGADPAPLTRYWSGTGDGNGARQLINSVARGRNGGSIDIVHLLPLFVRDYLYTYPRTAAGQGNGPDCFWSALSFDRQPPDFTVVNETYLIQRLKEDYESVREPFQVGDVVVFANEAGRIVHSCVYIAGNIVFTKNGASLFAPWVLMRLPDVAGFYADNNSPRIICFRKKKLKSG